MSYLAIMLELVKQYRHLYTHTHRYIYIIVYLSGNTVSTPHNSLDSSLVVLSTRKSLLCCFNTKTISRAPMTLHKDYCKKFIVILWHVYVYWRGCRKRADCGVFESHFSAQALLFEVTGTKLLWG